MTLDPAVLADPGFGAHFTDHMVLVDFSEQNGWHDRRVVPYGPLPMDPAATALQYGQEVFEGLKVYRHRDGHLRLFRPDMNARRFAASAAMFPSSTTSSFSTCGTKTSTLPMSCSSTHAGSYSLSHSGRSHCCRFSSEKRNLRKTDILKCSCDITSALNSANPSSCSRSSAR